MSVDCDAQKQKLAQLAQKQRELQQVLLLRGGGKVIDNQHQCMYVSVYLLCMELPSHTHTHTHAAPSLLMKAISCCLAIRKALSTNP